MTNYVQMAMRPSQQLDEFKSKQDESIPTELNKDFERANQRAYDAERLVEKLREELQLMQEKVNLLSQTTTNHSVPLTFEENSERKLREKLELELASKEHQIEKLTLDRDKLQSTLNKISDLENALSEREKLITELKCKLQNQSDYNDMKREMNTLKSLESSSSLTRLNDESQSTKKPFDLLLFDKNRTDSSLITQPTTIKSLSTDVENPSNANSVVHSCRHCSSPCLHRHNNAPCFPIPSLLSSSASSSSNSSSSPSSPSQIFLKTNPSLLATHETDETNKFLPPLPTTLTNKDNLPLNKYPSSISSSCSTIVTPTASLLSSVTTTTTTTSLTPSNLFAGHQISSVQCTKLHCPPTSSWSPPLSSSSELSSTATTSTDNGNSRTVVKPTKQPSPKSSPSPTILVPSSCPTMSTSNHTLEPLDTSYVANVVRKLLAQHNIGQRIFARYILSLSQGTVSELLSKPKSWTKLTEKGKESYRKMWCWANSEESILTLKSISPRKGMNNRTKDNPYPAVNTKHTDPATQQKIVQILADAQKQQMAAGVTMDQKASLSPCSSLANDSTQTNLLSNTFESKSFLSQTPSSASSTTSAASSAANSPLHESNTIGDQQSLLHPVPPPPVPSSAAPFSMLSAFVPSLLMRASNGMNNENTDNYRNWLMLQEIVRNNDLLKQFKPVLPPPIDTDESDQENEHDDDGDDDQSQEHDNMFDNDDEHQQHQQDDGDDNEGMTMHDDDEQQDEEDNPLDLSMKMDSSVTSDNEMNSSNHSKQQYQQQYSSSNNKHTKVALAPLREQDTMKYRYINTIELVQTVKDILSRYSISQRHFGEKILGLSQGSVSDILARPKPWELLTQKGREPFLRMRLFLDDQTAIKQLVQTVSTTPASNTPSILVPTFYPPLPPPSSILSTNPSLLNGFHSSSLLSRDHSIESQTNLLTNENPLATTTTTSILNTSTTSANDNPTVLPSSSPSPSNGSVNPPPINKSKSRSKSSKNNSEKAPVTSNPQKNSLMAPYELPKITLPSTIDTEQLSSQVRELLFAYSIGQRVFGEAVLNLSQGTVSEILSKPRSWHSLSVKGREPYIRMYTWFHDPGNVQKLLAWKKERDALRRARPTTTGTPSSASVPNESVGSTAVDQDTVTVTNPSRSAKRRSLFTDSQRRIFKQIFNNDPYPSQTKLEQLANEMSLPLGKVTNWFHNARMRAKINLLSSSSPTNILPSSSPVAVPSDQLNSDEDDLLDDNNNNPNPDEDDEDEENDEENEDDYPPLPTIVPVTSSWLNGHSDSNSSTSPVALSTTSTNIVSLIDEQKVLPMAVVSSSSSSVLSSSSKKRKSVPQKIITNHVVKKFNNGSTNDNSNSISHDETSTTNQSTTTVLDVSS